MHRLDEDIAAGLLESCSPPCLSLYQPTNRHHPDNQQDPIRFRNLVKLLEESLEERFSDEEVQPLLKPFAALAEDEDFWNHSLDGLAVLASPTLFRVYRLQRPVPELAVAADSFHTKPLLRIQQSADRYHVLGLSRGAMRMFEGNRDAMTELEPHPQVPRTVTDALGEEVTEPRHTVAAYGGSGGEAMHHGHGGRKAEVDKDAERYFRAVDRAVLEYHSKPSGLPLVLAALPEHHHLFHQVSHNPFLVSESLDVHPDALDSIDELRRRVWRLLEPQYLERLTDLIELFGSARAKGLGDADLVQVGHAVVAGRVETILIEAERVIPGRVDPAVGSIDFGDLTKSDVDDVLDDLAEMTLSRGGDVVIVPAERMPTDTGAAAIYRF